MSGEPEFVEQLRLLCRNSKPLNELLWGLMQDRGCESFSELYSELGQNERAELLSSLEELKAALSPGGMQARMK